MGKPKPILTDYASGPWKLTHSGYELYLVHAPTDTRLFSLDECQGINPEAKKILNVIVTAPQVLAGLKAALHQIHATASNHHALALKSAGSKEQVETLAEGLGTVMTQVQAALAQAAE